MNQKRSPHLLIATLAGLGGLLLGAGLVPVQAQDNRPASGAAGAGPAASGPSDRARRAEEKFLMKAHASGRREIQLSQLAASRATDPRVRSYAQQLVSEHQQMARDLKSLVSGAGLDLGTMDASPAMNGTNHGSPTDAGLADRPATVSTNTGHLDNSAKGVRDRWSRMLNDRKQRNLMEKSGADFDRTYIDLMVDEYESAVDLFQDGADDGNPQVQAFAAKYLPQLRQRLDEAEQLDKSLK